MPRGIFCALGRSELVGCGVRLSSHVCRLVQCCQCKLSANSESSTRIRNKAVFGVWRQSVAIYLARSLARVCPDLGTPPVCWADEVAMRS